MNVIRREHLNNYMGGEKNIEDEILYRNLRRSCELYNNLLMDFIF